MLNCYTAQLRYEQEAQLSQVEPRDTLCQLKSCQLLHSSKETHLKWLALGDWLWRSLKVIGIAAMRWAIHHFLLVVSSNNDSILHRFRDITILPHLQRTRLRSPRFSKSQLKLQATCAFWFTCKHVVDNTYYISWCIRVRKVSNSKSNLQGQSFKVTGNGAIR